MRRSSAKIGILSALVFFGMGGLSVPVNATVLYATGFESPTFVTGPIAGQDGWGVFGPSTASQVETAFVASGTQALGVLPALAVGQTGAFKSLVTAAPVIEQSGDIFLASSSTESGYQFAATGAGLLGFIGGIDVDPDGTIHAITAGFPIVGTLARDVFNNVDFIMNFTTQTWTLKINGTTLISDTPFCGNNFGPCNGAIVAAYGDGLFDTFPATEPNDLGALDNFSVSTVEAVPEPASLAILGTALAGFGLIRRRRKTA